MKYYTSEEIIQKFNSLSKPNQVSVLHIALDYMKQYNGRSKVLCIALAMGYDNAEGDTKSYFKISEAEPIDKGQD